MKAVSPDYYSEHIIGKSVIICGDEWHTSAIIGTQVAILNSLADVKAYEIALEHITHDSHIENWTAIFTCYPTIKTVKREIKTFKMDSAAMIEYAKSFFAEND